MKVYKIIHKFPYLSECDFSSTNYINHFRVLLADFQESEQARSVVGNSPATIPGYVLHSEPRQYF